MLMRTKKHSENGHDGKATPGLRQQYAAALTLSMLLTDVCLANVVGADTQNFNATTSGLDFVTVESAQTLDPGVVNFGFFLNDAVNSLPYFANDPQKRTAYTDSVLGADLNVGIGLLPGFDIGISAPQVLQQDSEKGGYHGQYNATGNTEARLNAKVQFYGTRDYGLALMLSENLNRINNDPYAGKNAGPTTNLQLAGDTTINNFKLGLNVGYRWRLRGHQDDPTVPVAPLPDQYIASGAISYLLTSIDTKAIFEVFGSLPNHSVTDASDRQASSAEALLGLKHDFTTRLAGHVGGGTQIVKGISSPDWRVYTGLNYTLGGYTKAKAEKIETVTQPQAVKADPFAGPPKPTEKIVVHDVLFEYDSDTLILGATGEVMTKLVAYLNTKPSFTRLIIEGHTDSIGSDPYNMDLSLRRANTIKRWLVSHYHLPAGKIITIGRGKHRPIADNGNYQGRQLNRRVEFTIYRDMAKVKPSTTPIAAATTAKPSNGPAAVTAQTKPVTQAKTK